MEATYSWTYEGTNYSASGTGTFSLTVAEPSVSISVQSAVQNGYSVTGTVKMSNPSTAPSNISLTLSSSSSDGAEVTFSPTTVSIPAGSTSATFQMTGAATSQAAGDVSVSGSGGASCSSKSVTVWAIGGATSTATPITPPDYEVSPGDGFKTLQSTSDHAINFADGVSVLPSVASASPDPRLALYSVGMVQNAGAHSTG